jgi:2-amino-4-hydroxy-6-hydroxymethyldihydropteridine diphosphokinase
MPDSVIAFIALGANLGEPRRQVEQALAELAALPRSRLLARSALYRSRAVGYLDQPDYLNAVARLETGLTPRQLLADLLDIERRHGRERTFRNSPRTLDLDILLYDELLLNEPGLHLPHPRMHERPFVLVPLAEIAPDIVIPGNGPVRTLLDALDRRSVTRLPAPQGKIARHA